MTLKSCICLAALAIGMKALFAESPAAAPADSVLDGISQTRQAWLIGFCVETRFGSLAQVDSLTSLTPDEKAFCKARLRLLNPLID
jgi:hypothetical protein